MINYNERRTPIILSDGVHDFGVNCSNCADHISGPWAYIETYIHGESVALCSGTCWRKLLAVWAPAPRVCPFSRALVGIAMLAVMLF